MRKLQLFGHICRMPDDRLLKTYYCLEWLTVSVVRENLHEDGLMTFWSGVRGKDLRCTSTGLDHLSACFLRLGAPFFAKPLANLISLSFETSTVPVQWKQARICPVPKTASPAQLSDFRPISITSVLSRVTERIIVKDYLFPSWAVHRRLWHLPISIAYAFRPSGSTIYCWRWLICWTVILTLLSSP